MFCKEDSLSQLAAASFGQTFTITPIQLITAVSACVNGGYLMEPYLVKQITDQTNTTGITIWARSGSRFSANRNGRSIIKAFASSA